MHIEHLEKNEIFVLLHGKCTLVSEGKQEFPEKIEVIEMKLHKLYNIKQGTWHNHTLDKDREILIVDNQNTSDENSPIFKMTDKMIKEIIDLLRL